MFWTFFFIVVIMYILNALSKRYGLKGITYKREFSKKSIEIGEEIEMTMIVENRKVLPVTFLQITEKFPNGLRYKFKANTTELRDNIYHKSTMYIMPYQRIRRKYKLYGETRGSHIFRDITIESGDFAGFDTTSQSMESLEEVVVFPKSLNLEENLIPYGNYNGDISVRRWIIDDPLMTIGINEYTGNEPQKYIHWPSSMRYGKLMVKKFDFTTDNSVMILLNIESCKPFWVNMDKGKIEKCISLTRGIMDQLEKNKIPYGFSTNSRTTDFNSERDMTQIGLNRGHYEHILECLGRISYEVMSPFEDFLENVIDINRNFTTFILVVPEVFDSYIEPIEKLNSQVQKLIIISLGEENMEYLDDSIMKFIERK